MLRMRDAMTTTRRRRRSRKGVALVLVLVAMASATILSGTYLVSRRNSAAIGTNALRAAQAKWASESAAEYAFAALQTNINWFDADPTEFIGAMVFGPATVRVFVTNLSGQTPSPTDSDLVITAVANVDGVFAQTQKLVQYKSGFGTASAYDPLLDEFAVYAIDSAAVDSTSSMFQWPDSPNYHAGRPVKVGGAFTDSMDALYDPNAELISASLYVRDDASLSLQGLVGQPPFESGGTTPSVMPVPPAKLPATLATLPLVSAGDIAIPPGTNIGAVSPGGHFRLTGLGKDSEATIDGVNGMDYRFTDIELNAESILKIKGDVRIHVENDLRVLNDAVIEVDKNANVVLYVGGDVVVDDAAVGFSKGDARDDNRSVDKVLAKYAPASQIRVMGLRRDVAVDGPASVRLHNSAVARMVVHAPMADVRIENGSGLFGRATGYSFTLQSGASLVYDTALDQGVGITEPLGPLYDESGNLIAELYAALSGFDETLADAEDLEALLEADARLADFPDKTITTVSTATERDPRRAVARPWPTEAAALEATAVATVDSMPWTAGTQQLVDAYIAETKSISTTVEPRTTEPTTTTTSSGSEANLVDETMNLLLAPVQN